MIWFIVFIVALGIELMTTALISIWFAIGSLFALASIWMGASILVQGIIFIVVSVLALILTKPYVEKKLLPKTKVEKTNVDALVGTKAIVTVEISNLHGNGEVQLDGKEWTARSVNEESISVGETVIVERIEGVKAIVSRLKEERGE
ncbi:NfeD family protein [Bacillus sp. M6-12]|uniref:NfeD family protein n=1 Tax=Bacillus sp. M6-12 TaxID=2054166 RepID=UPI000C778C71|nr:NfeD family protein [Bacillus sp. M6-12]PLS19623.1 NfeD family protein [Bacillus sp. M6-12]